MAAASAELKATLLKQGFKETGSVALDISLSQCWAHYFADNSVNNFTEFWRQVMEATDINATNWDASLPDLGKDHSRKDDNFKAGFKDSPLQVKQLRVLSATVPIKNNPMASSANVKKI